MNFIGLITAMSSNSPDVINEDSIDNIISFKLQTRVTCDADGTAGLWNQHYLSVGVGYFSIPVFKGIGCFYYVKRPHDMVR